MGIKASLMAGALSGTGDEMCSSLGCTPLLESGWTQSPLRMFDEKTNAQHPFYTPYDAYEAEPLDQYSNMFESIHIHRLPTDWEQVSMEGLFSYSEGLTLKCRLFAAILRHIDYIWRIRQLQYVSKNYTVVEYTMHIARMFVFSERIDSVLRVDTLTSEAAIACVTLGMKMCSKRFCGMDNLIALTGYWGDRNIRMDVCALELVICNAIDYRFQFVTVSGTIFCANLMNDVTEEEALFLHETARAFYSDAVVEKQLRTAHRIFDIDVRILAMLTFSMFVIHMKNYATDGNPGPGLERAIFFSEKYYTPNMDRVARALLVPPLDDEGNAGMIYDLGMQHLLAVLGPNFFAEETLFFIARNQKEGWTSRRGSPFASLGTV